MFNLIRRDVILQKWQIILFIPIIMFFIIFGSHDPAFIFVLASGFIPFNTFYYDEKTESNILLNSLPYTRSEIIASRYLSAIIYMTLSIGIASLGMYVFNKPFTTGDIALGAGLFLVFAALTFPLFQILKPGYITTVVMIAFIVLSVLSGYIVTFINNHLTALMNFIASLSVPALYTGAAVVVMTIYAISWGVTTVIYERKAF